MPTRRTFELVVAVVILSRPVFGMIKLWSVKTLGTTKPGTIMHGAAEIGSVIF